MPTPYREMADVIKQWTESEKRKEEPVTSDKPIKELLNQHDRRIIAITYHNGKFVPSTPSDNDSIILLEGLRIIEERWFFGTHYALTEYGKQVYIYTISGMV